MRCDSKGGMEEGRRALTVEARRAGHPVLGNQVPSGLPSVVPRPAASTSPGALLDVQTLIGPCHRPTNQKFGGGGKASNVCFSKPSGHSDTH